MGEDNSCVTNHQTAEITVVSKLNRICLVEVRDKQFCRYAETYMDCWK